MTVDDEDTFSRDDVVNLPSFSARYVNSVSVSTVRRRRRPSPTTSTLVISPQQAVVAPRVAYIYFTFMIALHSANSGSTEPAN